MAYDGRQDRYQYAQAHPGSRAHARQDRADYNQYPPGNGGYQDHNDQVYPNYQEQAFDDNQQYHQNYNSNWEQGQGQRQNSAGAGRYQENYNYQETYQTEQQRSYQYDDRFRSNSRPEQQHETRGNPPTGRRSPQSRPGTSASSRKVKQERILDSAGFDMPKAMAWDNPFGVFPGTKKDAEQKKKAAEEARSKSRAETPTSRSGMASSRPPTSAGQREPKQIPNDRRPHTSHSRRPQSLEDNPTLLDGLSSDGPYGPAEDVPIRRNRPFDAGTQYDAADARSPPIDASGMIYNSSLPTRHPPQRSVTGLQPDQNGQYYHEDMQNSSGEQSHSTYIQPTGNGQWDHEVNANSRPDLASYRSYGERGPSRNKVHVRNVSDENNYTGDIGNLAYRGVKPSKSLTNFNNSSMPNFAAMPVNATDNIEREVTLQSKPAYSAYQKPTYGEASSRPQRQPQSSQRVPVRPGLAADQDSGSPNQFDFGIGTQGQYSAPTQRGNPQRELHTSHTSRAEQQHLPGPQTIPPTNDRQQFPPRKGSRPEAQAPGSSHSFRHPYNQTIPSKQSAQQQSSFGDPMYAAQEQPQGGRAARQEYGFDEQSHPSASNYDNPYADDPVYEQYPNQQARRPNNPPGLVRSQTEPVNQQFDAHHDQRFNQRGTPSRTQTFAPGFEQQAQQANQARQPHQYDQTQAYDQNGYPLPARPRTANSARPPPHEYSSRDTSRPRPPNSGLPVADRNHPIPVRPGLMTMPSAPVSMPQAPPPRVQPEARTQPPPQNKTPQKSQVSSAQLNELRDAYRNRPNDDALGLEFAKKLVEAASVLASEGGRADPKQTARNREKYINDAYRLVKKLAGGGSSDAMFYLADCYGTGQLGLEINPKEAFQLYTSAAKTGHAQAAYRVAVCCEMGADSGGGTRRDYVKAVQYYKKAATLGDGPAMFKMGAVLMKGLLGQQANRREGIQWLKRAAERADAENPHALHELGMIYENARSDDVVLKDERYAMELFTKAANLGYKHSQTRLGSAYEYGLMGCPIDPQRSITWYSKAAAQGEHLAEFALSGWYLTGAPPLLEASDQEAYLWARKAAASGLAKAEYAMGYYTETGIGITPNVEEAKKWYFRAAAQNDDRARNRLEEFKRGAGRKERGRVSRSGVGRQNEGECTVM